MDVRFLLGPAGSGKTFQCLAEIRAALLAAPDGPPLLFLAPKQATFQLERQLLLHPELPGYTRLHILSFERLADWVFDQLPLQFPAGGESGTARRECGILSEEGRLMVLRALLARHRDGLQLFHSTARLPGFAQQLSLVLREFQQCQLGPDSVRSIAAKTGLKPALRAKLSDCALLLEAYLNWLRDHRLEDPERRLDLAADALNTDLRSSSSGPWIQGVWLDGFAEMTPQELGLLRAILSHAQRATLAFCIDRPLLDDVHWLSTWSLVAQTFRRCHHAVESVPDATISIETLPSSERSRFTGNPELQHLQQYWTDPKPYLPDAHPQSLCQAVQIMPCHDPEAEAVFAAREICRSVRAGFRYRDVAVLVRSLDAYLEVVRRVFVRYEIPCFIDRREPVAHHPLAELTRFALRTISFGWQQDDWFAVLKTGLLPAPEGDLDLLENEARSRGLSGTAWLQPVAASENRLERLRQEIMPPFLRFAHALSGSAPAEESSTSAAASRSCEVTGAELSAALAQLWIDLDIPGTLERWSEATPSAHPKPDPVHQTVWDQMNEWRENIALAFATEPLPLREWLAIVETGLSHLTVGAIPPALDQVLIGAVDRSRNPDLKLAIVLGMNESVFPAPPPKPLLLTEAERAELEGCNVHLTATTRQRLGHERYLAYIACTRARQRVVLTHAATDCDGKPLNPSPILAHLQQLFPALNSSSSIAELEGLQPSASSECADGHSPPQPGPETAWLQMQHPHELVPAVLRRPALRACPDLLELPAVQRAITRCNEVETARRVRQLAPDIVQKLYGSQLLSSVSALEQFAACPFKFFVQSGLRARERDEFQADHREKGSFQHKILQEFHHELQREKKRWRDVSPTEARRRIARIGETLIAQFERGLFNATPDRRFSARLLIEQLESFIEVMIGWMSHYCFDPAAVEVGFGFPETPVPAWQLDLGDGHALLLRGWIDRVDLCPVDADTALAVIIDYKSSGRRLDPVKLQHGLELQLFSYLGLLRSLSKPPEMLAAQRLIPAGVFYVSLRPELTGSKSRARNAERENKKSGHEHVGRFNAEYLQLFDSSGAPQGRQFRFRLKKNGELYSNSQDALNSAAFQGLIDSIERQLKQIGREIYAGNISIAPFRKKTETACTYCLCRPICRFDPWTDPYRVLPAKASAFSNTETFDAD